VTFIFLREKEKTHSLPGPALNGQSIIRLSDPGGQTYISVALYYSSAIAYDVSTGYSFFIGRKLTICVAVAGTMQTENY